MTDLGALRGASDEGVIGSRPLRNRGSCRAGHQCSEHESDAIALGGVSTLKMTAGTGVNANFYLLVPAPMPPTNVVLTASLSGINLVLSFPTQTGFSYQVYCKNNLTDASWTMLGSAVAGDGSVKSVSDGLSNRRFYRLSIQ